MSYPTTTTELREVAKEAIEPLAVVCTGSDRIGRASGAPSRLRSKNQTVVSGSFLKLLAHTVVVIHIGFVFFVVLGGLLVLRWPQMMWLHLPAAVWGIAVEFADWLCPLTPLENLLREHAGMTAYEGDFVEQYLLPLLYPSRLTRVTQLLLGTFALAINTFIYWRVARVHRR